MKAYTKYLQKQYFKLIATHIHTLDDKILAHAINTHISNKVAKVIQSIGLDKLNYLPLVTNKMIDRWVNQALIHDMSTYTVLSNRMYKLLFNIWHDSFELGKQHQTLDLLDNSGLFTKELSNLDTLSNFAMDSFDIANFAKSKKTKITSNSEAKAKAKSIARAKRNLTILTRNMEKMQASDSLYQNLANQKSIGIASRMSISQKAIFLDTIKYISNYDRKAQATSMTFLGDNYLQNRIRVLSQDYAAKYDAAVKAQIGTFLQQNIEGVRQIASRHSAVQGMATSIQTMINQSNAIQPASYRSSATNIIRTELSLGYNFGKLSGFLAPEDLTKQFKWNADFELERRIPDYRVCTWCEDMNGRVYTVQELLENTGLDPGGVMTYTGTNKSEWKNSSLPQIPFHPNCVTSKVSVLSYNKEIKIEDVRINDLVYVPTSRKYELVTKTHKNWYDGNLYKIRFSNGTECTYTANHPIWTSKGWIDAKQLREGDTAFAYSKDVYTSMQNVSRSSTSKDNLQDIKRITKNCNQNFEANQITQNTTGNSYRTKQITKTTSNLFREHEKEQSNAYTWNSTKSKRQYSKEWFTRGTLQIQNWQRILQDWLQRGYWSIRQKFLGGQCSSNTEETRYNLGIREKGTIIKWKNLSNRLLSTSMGCVYRSKRLLDRRGQTEIQSILTRIPAISSSTSRSNILQGVNQQFQGLVPVRVISIESYIEPQYVYNLTVENAEVYFANGILGHNCSCFWTIVPEREENIVDKTAEGIWDNLPMIAGIGAIATAGFLLSRQMAWSNLVKAAVAVNNRAKTTITREVIDTTISNADDLVDLEDISIVTDILDDIGDIDLKNAFLSMVTKLPEELT